MIDIHDLKTRLKDEKFLHQTLLPGFAMFIGAMLTLWCLCAACINLFEMLIASLVPLGGLVIGAALISWADDVLNPVEEEAHNDDCSEEA